MRDDERAVSKTISLYPSQINAVERFAEFKKFKDFAKGYQFIIEDFFTKDDKKVKHDFMLFFIVPVIFCVLTTVVNIYTDRVFTNLIEQGFYYYELHILSRVFTVLSFGSIGILIACIYWLRKVRLVRHNIEVDNVN